MKVSGTIACGRYMADTDGVTIWDDRDGYRYDYMIHQWRAAATTYTKSMGEEFVARHDALKGIVTAARTRRF